MKTIHCLIILIIAFKECISSEAATQNASIIELEHAIHNLNIFPTVLIKLIGSYARPQEWVLSNKWRITREPNAYVTAPWAVSHDNTLAAIGIEQGVQLKVKIFDFRKIMPGIKVLETNFVRYNPLASFSYDDTLLAITSNCPEEYWHLGRRWTQILNTGTWILAHKFHHKSAQPQFLPHSTRMVVGRENFVEILESTTGELIERLEYQSKNNINSEVNAIAITPDETILAVAYNSDDGTDVRLIHLKTWQTIKTIAIQKSFFIPYPINTLLFSANNNFLLYKAYHGTNYMLHDIISNKTPNKQLLKVPSFREFAWSDYATTWAQFLPDNESIAFIESSSKISTIKISEHAKLIKNRECLLKHPQSPEKAALKYFTVSRCGTIIVAAGENNIYLWKLQDIEK
jgi:hypothetical protein